MPSPVVRYQNVSISYRRDGRPVQAVHDMSFDIPAGTTFGLVGESGCGKTTVAMALMRYLPENACVDRGTIEFCGEDLMAVDDATLRRWRGGRIAMVYQDPASALNPTMRVGDQVAEVYRQHLGHSAAQAREDVVAMLERVHLTDAANVSRRYPHELSGGQQQRVVIAMALAARPQLLVLDEPTTGLDATVEAGVLDLIEELRETTDAAIMFISHNLGIVARICDRVGVLYAGRMVEEGPAKDVLGAPGHPYTAALLQAVPRLASRKTGHRLTGIPGLPLGLGLTADLCAYADRCSLERPRCRESEPALEAIAADRTARCYFSDEVRPPAVATASLEGAEPASSSEEVLLSVEGLVKTYRTRGRSMTAVAGVSFEVRRGEIFALVGESGSGKSTVAKCITGVVAPTDGRMLLDGAEVSKQAYRRDRALRRRVQMVFQNPEGQLNPRHSIGKILRRCIDVLGGSASREAREAALRELVASVQLSEAHLPMRPRRLSGGQRQRVAIACALAGQPELLVCDEPASALDVSVQAGVLNLLADLQASQQVSIVLISHDLVAVHYLADRVGVMYLGQLVETTQAADVFSAPHHPYTEALLSSVPHVDADETIAPQVKLTGTMPSPSQPPSGCRFHTRCPRFLGDVCATVEPPWQQAGGTAYRCHIPPETLREQQLAARAAPATDRSDAELDIPVPTTPESS